MPRRDVEFEAVEAFFDDQSKKLADLHIQGRDVPCEYEWPSHLHAKRDMSAEPVLSALSGAIQQIAIMFGGCPEGGSSEFNMLMSMSTLYAIYVGHYKKYGMPGEPMSFSDMTGLKVVCEKCIN